ncbi:MAG: hypothetical protein K2L38_08330 [Dysosmobacter sp.]|nr:hypothetical protein [Dysosmobacter sp.]
MEGKPNIRSIRFSDELAELIERQVRSTFTEKFENLVTRCVWELPQKEEELKRLQKDIEQERRLLVKLMQKRRNLDQVIQSIQQNLDYQLEKLKKL